MVAGNATPARAWPWAMIPRQLLFSLAPIAAFAIAWWASGLIQSPVVWLQVLCYGLVHLLLIAARRFGLLRSPVAVGLGLAADAVFGVLLLYQANTLGIAFYALYALVALRTISVYRLTPFATVVPFALGPIFLFARAIEMPFAALPGAEQTAAYGLLLGSLGFGIGAIWASTAIVRTNFHLKQELKNAQDAGDLRVSQLERSANDLRARMREQHALEEGLRVITSTLSLDEVLRQIVDSTVHMLGESRASGVALSLSNGAGFDHRSSSEETALAPRFADTIAARTLAQQVPLIINDLSKHTDLGNRPHEIASVLSVPLFVGENQARGALTVVSAERGMFDSVDARHLSALALQAGIAIHNAGLHSRMQQQRRLMEAVMRDITEAMVVLDAQQQVVLMNPLGRRLLEGSATHGSVRNQVLELTASMRAEGRPIATSEIKLGEDGEEHEADAFFYQAWASQVRQHDDDEPLVAVVLHDITAQKAEERGKQEFISMVAHELRNPLHSMNGFVKLVLQGKVGPLTDMQEEFLGIVDSQIGLLNGRIAELLEYNRVQAGRLVLNPQRGDMPMLVAGTVMRLSLQAQHNGLSLSNDVAADLPECYFDHERIGQVLTNLIENAIKATPPGGGIRVASELHEDEMWIRVYDTGVGIAPEDKAKIFQAFYRAHDRASSKGNHLGLGLAICAQIIEGHRGRIWVESEQGKGSCFSFALPLHGRE